MPRKKTDESVNVTELDEINQGAEEADDIIPDETEEAEPDEEVKLVKGASFTSGGRVYGKEVPEKVSAETAEKLIKTGFFERV
jgi:hypothetical protein